jgi:hypothetical protein
MHRSITNASLFFVTCTLLIACGPSEAELNAQGTAITASIFATQTAQAPTPTNTPTDTPTPTSTPTEIPTPTPTITPTPGFPLPAGWQNHESSGFYLALPQGWETVSVDKEGIEAIQTILKGLNTEWAQNASSMLTTEAVQNALKFWAMDTKPAGIGYAAVNVSFQAMPFTTAIEDICLQMKAAYEQVGVDVLESECGLEINQLPVARYTLRLVVNSFAIKQYQYVYVQGRNMWALTLAVDETVWAKYQPIFETIAQSFGLAE